MAYNEKLAERIRAALKGKHDVEEKKMFGGIAFMINDKMCVGVMKDDLLLRCDPADREALLQRNGAKKFEMGSKESNSWLMVGPEGTKLNNDFEWWVEEALAGHKQAKVSKKRK